MRYTQLLGDERVVVEVERSARAGQVVELTRRHRVGDALLDERCQQEHDGQCRSGVQLAALRITQSARKSSARFDRAAFASFTSATRIQRVPALSIA